MNTSSNKYNSSLPKLYQYPNWELPATNVILSHSLLGLSGYKELLQEKQSQISHLVGLSRQETNYVLLDETFYQLLINEHYKLNEYYSIENIQKQKEEEKLLEEKFEKARELNDEDTIEKLEYEDFLHQSKLIEIEQDKIKCQQRNFELNNNKNIFPNLQELKHGDIIQFRNERLQFSFYIYQAKKGTFEQLLKKFKEYVQNIIEHNGIIDENDHSIKNFQFLSTNQYELMLIPSIESDGYGIPSLFNDAPLYYFKHLSSGLMYRWVYLQLIDSSMSIYDIVQKDIQLKKQYSTYRTLINEGGYETDNYLINEQEDGEEMTIEDLNTFPNDYVFIYDEIKTKLNIEWRKINTNDYCNQYSSMYLLTKWTQQLQYDT